MPNPSPEKSHALQWVNDNQQSLSDFHRQIWDYAEPAWREYRSANAFCDILESEGFHVERGSGQMPTAFLATYGSGVPVLGTYAEYDAVPGTSQQPVPYQAPREGLHPWAAGHTDPHSSLGVAALAGILAAKGYYDDFDAFISYHPHPTNTTIWDTHCGSYWSAVFTFECHDPESWVDPELLSGPNHPHSAPRCPGAIDALCLMYTNTKYTKEAMYPHTGAWTLNEFIMAGGQCTSDNLPPRFSQIQYAWRSPNLDIQQRIFNVLENNARSAAEATGCEVSIRWVTKTRVGLPNHAMAQLTYDNLALVGPPVLDEDARAFGRAVQQNLGLDQMENPFTDECQQLISPTEFEAQVRQQLPPWQANYTSDDYVDYTWHAPTVRLHTARPSLKPPSPGYLYPAWVRNALGGVSSCIDPGMFVAAKTIAATLVDLLTQPDLLAKAQEEFRIRTGGGIGGDNWVAPLLPRDFPPPTDLRWPEYIETPRGREWWLPTPIA